MRPPLDRALSRLEEKSGHHLEAFSRLVEVESVSRVDTVGPSMLEAARQVEEGLRSIGLAETELIGIDDSAPYVFASSPGVPGAPTVLLYAHYDVQPVGDAAAWTSDPFSLTERDGRLFARGSADDKGGVITHIAALDAWLSGAGALPLTVKVLIEGEEEIGSRHFRDLLARDASRFACDFVVIPDSMGWEVGRPAMTCSTRGAVTGVVEFSGLPKALHSGTWGGVNPDPTLSLCTAIASLSTSGSVDLDILRERDRTPAETIRQLDRISPAEVAERLGVDELASIDDDLPQKLWNEATLTVVGFDAPPVVSAPLAIQPDARAKINLRLPPGVNPQAAADEVVTRIRSATPPGLRSSIAFSSLQTGWVADLSHPAYRAAEGALEMAYGTPVTRQGTGGTLPLLRWLGEYLQDPACIILGIADPFSNAHAADESIDLAGWRSLCAAETRMIGNLACLKPDDAPAHAA